MATKRSFPDKGPIKNKYKGPVRHKAKKTSQNNDTKDQSEIRHNGPIKIRRKGQVRNKAQRTSKKKYGIKDVSFRVRVRVRFRVRVRIRIIWLALGLGLGCLYKIRNKRTSKKQDSEDQSDINDQSK
jgi:hypothetical protein